MLQLLKRKPRAPKHVPTPPFYMGTDDYIAALYREVLRRNPDEDGIRSYRELIQRSGDPTIVLASFLTSDEYRTLNNRPEKPADREGISDISLLVHRMDEALSVRKNDIAAGSAMASSFYFDVPDDIRSSVNSLRAGTLESYDRQMKLIYEPIAGHPHRIELEGHDSSFMTPANAFPFYLGPKDSGHWLMAYGFFLKALGLPHRAKVMEIGFGAGGLTEFLVRSGLDVTGVELHETNCKTLRDRVEAFSGSVKTIITDSAQSFEFPEHYDAIVFYESFHHMVAPVDLLSHLKKFLKPGGIFGFGAEPIQPASDLMPFPWGLRMDGDALAAIRDLGWVEFGFQTDFFVSMLADLGFTAIRSSIPDSVHCDAWIARPID